MLAVNEVLLELRPLENVFAFLFQFESSGTVGLREVDSIFELVNLRFLAVADQVSDRRIRLVDVGRECDGKKLVLDLTKHEVLLVHNLVHLLLLDSYPMQEVCFLFNWLGFAPLRLFLHFSLGFFNVF